MRINIARTSVDPDYLMETAEDYGNRESINPYIIMSQKTLNKLMEACGNKIIVSENGSYEIDNYKILINQDLHFGDVDIR